VYTITYNIANNVYTVRHTNGMNVYTVRQFRMFLKEALDNAPCEVRRGTQVFTITPGPVAKETPRGNKALKSPIDKKRVKQELARAVDAMQVCKKGHLYKGTKCMQKGCQ
jgi:hypothetical protein